MISPYSSSHLETRPWKNRVGKNEEAGAGESVLPQTDQQWGFKEVYATRPAHSCWGER